VTRPRFALRRVHRLKEHEEVVPEKVRELVVEIQRTGRVIEPIWVARRTGVILNGHHRFAALRQLGAKWVPAWVLDYDDGTVALTRWSPGPPLSKKEILLRARQGRLLPPKTSRHTVVVDLPDRETPLAVLLGGESARSGRADRRRSRSRARRRLQPRVRRLSSGAVGSSG
jgi:hypothetical protein